MDTNTRIIRRPFIESLEQPPTPKAPPYRPRHAITDDTATRVIVPAAVAPEPFPPAFARVPMPVQREDETRRIAVPPAESVSAHVPPATPPLHGERTTRLRPPSTSAQVMAWARRNVGRFRR